MYMHACIYIYMYMYMYMYIHQYNLMFTFQNAKVISALEVHRRNVEIIVVARKDSENSNASLGSFRRVPWP